MAKTLSAPPPPPLFHILLTHGLHVNVMRTTFLKNIFLAGKLSPTTFRPLIFFVPVVTRNYKVPSTGSSNEASKKDVCSFDMNVVCDPTSKTGPSRQFPNVVCYLTSKTGPSRQFPNVVCYLTSKTQGLPANSQILFGVFTIK